MVYFWLVYNLLVFESLVQRPLHPFFIAVRFWVKLELYKKCIWLGAQGASLLYLTSFCRELLGKTVSLETCRADLLHHCNIGPLSHSLTKLVVDCPRISNFLYKSVFIQLFSFYFIRWGFFIIVYKKKNLYFIT